MKIVKLLIFTDGASFNNGYKNPDLPQHATGSNIIYREGKGVINVKVFDYGDNTISYAELASVEKAIEYAFKNYEKLIKMGVKLETTIVSDSAYVVRSFNEYSVKWEKNGYTNSTGDDISYKDIWKNILSLKHKFPIKLVHTKGHKTDDSLYTQLNNKADKLATKKLKEWKMENGYK